MCTSCQPASAAKAGLVFCCRIRHGCSDAAELQGAHGHPGTRLPSGPQRQRHGGHRSDRLWENLIGETHVFSAACAPQEAMPEIKHSRATFSPLLCPQYLLPAIVHINHQPYLERGDGPIVSKEKKERVTGLMPATCV